MDRIATSNRTTVVLKMCHSKYILHYLLYSMKQMLVKWYFRRILKWSRHSGPTPTDKTGPNYDHTCGPPTAFTTANPMVPLSPAHMNHSHACVGYYFFVNMNVTGPNKERADFASTAVMKTVIFNPPPKVHGDISSRYYNCCMVSYRANYFSILKPFSFENLLRLYKFLLTLFNI